MNSDIILKEHMDNNGHEGRIVFLEQSFSQIIESLGDLKTQIQVQGNQIANLLERFKSLESPGSGRMCELHKDSLAAFKADLAVQRAEIESVKGRVLAWGGAIALAAFLLPFFVTHWGKSTNETRLDKMEQNQQTIMKQLDTIKKP